MHRTLPPLSGEIYSHLRFQRQQRHYTGNAKERYGLPIIIEEERILCVPSFVIWCKQNQSPQPCECSN
jgi:hypothetical protein